jgi:hypothetical protein
MADPSRAAMSSNWTATMASTCTSSNSAAAPCAAASTTAAAPTTMSEQRTGRCDQQCRYADYCKKLGYPHHDALLIRAQPGPTIFPLSFKIGAHRVFHADY